MARRKRLTFDAPAPAPEPSQSGALETKAYVNGWEGLPPARPAPISDMAGAASAKAALEELASEVQEAREGGRMVLSLPLDQIDETYLVRDRIVEEDEDMIALRTSIAARGQQVPLEVVELAQGRFGLISGWRRLMALRALSEPEALCLLRRPEHSAEAYVAMVEENEIRAGISFYERARVAARAAEQGVYGDLKQALNGLFGSVPRSKRSKIRSFVGVYDALDDVLRFPASLSERAGLALAKALQEDGCADRVRAALKRADPQTAEEELAALNTALQPPRDVAETETKPQDSDEPDGVHLSRTKRGLLLSGSGVDAEFEARLRDWLSETGAL